MIDLKKELGKLNYLIFEEVIKIYIEILKEEYEDIANKVCAEIQIRQAIEKLTHISNTIEEFFEGINKCDSSIVSTYREYENNPAVLEDFRKYNKKGDK